MLEDTSGRLQSNFLIKAESAMRSDRVTQGFFPLRGKNLQGCGLHNPWATWSFASLFSEWKRFSFYPVWNFFLFQVTFLVSCPPTIYCCEEPGSILLITISRSLQAAARFPWTLPQTWSLSLCSQVMCSNRLQQQWLLLDSLYLSYVLLAMCGWGEGRVADRSTSVWRHKRQADRHNLFTGGTGSAPVNPSQDTVGLLCSQGSFQTPGKHIFNSHI